MTKTTTKTRKADYSRLPVGTEVSGHCRDAAGNLYRWTATVAPSGKLIGKRRELVR